MCFQNWRHGRGWNGTADVTAISKPAPQGTECPATWDKPQGIPSYVLGFSSSHPGRSYEYYPNFLNEETGSDRLGDLQCSRTESSSNAPCLSPELYLGRAGRTVGEREGTQDLPAWEGSGVQSWPQTIHFLVRTGCVKHQH